MNRSKKKTGRKIVSDIVDTHKAAYIAQILANAADARKDGDKRSARASVKDAAFTRKRRNSGWL